MLKGIKINLTGLDEIKEMLEGMLTNIIKYQDSIKDEIIHNLEVKNKIGKEDNKRLFLLTYDVCGVDNKECYSAIKELKEFSSAAEVKKYHNDKITELSNKTKELKFKCNGGSIVDLKGYIQEQGFDYQINKRK
ncbi:MAG TPA: hypothetical protein VIK86_00225 [Candidatus Paceibacterota bacterium]